MKKEKLLCPLMLMFRPLLLTEPFKIKTEEGFSEPIYATNLELYYCDPRCAWYDIHKGQCILQSIAEILAAKP